MNNNASSKTSLFLMELIIAIFFFSISAAICVRLFVSAHTLAEKTVNLNNAVTWSQNLAECFNSEKGDIEKIADYYPSTFVSEDTLILFFDDNWEIMDGSLTKASYEAILVTKKEAAKEVYSDIREYQSYIDGMAICGDIYIIDVKGQSDVITAVSEDYENIILSDKVDVYLGKESH